MLAKTKGAEGGDEGQQGEESGRPDGGVMSKKSNGKASSKKSSKNKPSQCSKCPRLIALMHELKNHLQILKPKADQRDEYHVSYRDG